MKKLYHVSIEATVYVIADHEDEAGHVALKALQDDMDGCDVDVVSVVEPSKSDLPDHWKQAYPYGDDSAWQQTCSWWVSLGEDGA